MYVLPFEKLKHVDIYKHVLRRCVMGVGVRYSCMERGKRVDGLSFLVIFQETTTTTIFADQKKDQGEEHKVLGDSGLAKEK